MSNTINPMDYKDYPQCMFAMLSAFLPIEEGHDLRRAAGGVFFRSTDQDGNTYRNGVLHSFNDEPTIQKEEGKYKAWYKNGQLHREGDLPAITRSEPDTQWWYKNGQLHRDGDLPAIVYRSGELFWYKEGHLHRDGDKPAVITPNDQEWYQEWYQNGKLHRKGDKPARVRRNGDREWYKKGLRHRDYDHPAIVYESIGYMAWFQKGRYTK
jgi:hypothetical protein